MLAEGLDTIYHVFKGSARGNINSRITAAVLKSLKKSLSALKQCFSLTLDNEMRESPISSNRLREVECNPMPKCQTFNAPMHTNALS